MKNEKFLNYFLKRANILKPLIGSTVVWYKAPSRGGLEQVLEVQTDLFSSAQKCYLWPPVKNYVLLYSTLLRKLNARALSGHKNYIPTNLGGTE